MSTSSHDPAEPEVILNRPVGEDSTGRLILPGDRVRYRGREYTLLCLPARRSGRGFPSVKLEGLDDPDADEVAVDFVSRPG